MSVPDLPSRSHIRTVADKALAGVGFERSGSWQYCCEVDGGLTLSLLLTGNSAFQSVHLGVICSPANKIAVEIWDEIGRHWVDGKKQLFPGVTASKTLFRGGPVRDDATWTVQRLWTFISIPGGDAPVSVETFAADVSGIATAFARSTSTLQAASANPRLAFVQTFDLQPTVLALLGDRAAFEGDVTTRLEYLAAADRRQRAGKLGFSNGPMLDFRRYYDTVRKRFFS